MKLLNQNNKIIVMSESKTLSTRNNAIKLIEAIKELHKLEVIVDFNDIEVMSRSFAHEYQKQKDLLACAVKDINVKSFLKEMFVISKQKRQAPRIDFSSWPVEKLPC